MSSPTRRGGIPGPESRTGLTRPSMTEAEFERRLGTQAGGAEAQTPLAIGSEPGDGAAGAETEAAGRSATRPCEDTADPGEASKAEAGPADVRDRGGAGQEALALRHPHGQGPLRGRQRPAPAARRLDGPVRLAGPTWADGMRSWLIDRASDGEGRSPELTVNGPASNRRGRAWAGLNRLWRLMKPGFESGQAEGLEHASSSGSGRGSRP